MRESLQFVRKASYTLAVARSEDKSDFLKSFAESIRNNSEFLLTENKKDLQEQEGQISQALYQRLELSESKIEDLVAGIEDIAAMEDPVGQLLSKTKIADDLILEKKRVPIGVIGVVFESRPDVIPQILALCLKSGNACVLKGGKEAHHSNRAFMKLVQDLRVEYPWAPESWALLLDSRESFHEMLKHHDLVDLVIPRGSNELVKAVMEATKIPVIGHADGVCHLYFHEKAELMKSLEIIIDAKCQYPSACNAVETLLIDEKVAERFFPEFEKEAKVNGVQIKGCPMTCAHMSSAMKATESDWQTEYGDKILAVKVVRGLDEAIDHINSHGSHHTDGILTEDSRAAEIFLQEVDSASVFVNASTRFADGYRFGLGAEVGISTNKTHARGPVGIEGLVIYKYQLRGNGQTVGQFSGKNAKQYLHERLGV